MGGDTNVFQIHNQKMQPLPGYWQGGLPVLTLPPAGQVWRKSIIAGAQRNAGHELTTSNDVVYSG